MPKTTKLTIRLSDDLDKSFRGAVFEWKGMKRGNIQEALQIAIRDWVTKERSTRGTRRQIRRVGT